MNLSTLHASIESALTWAREIGIDPEDVPVILAAQIDTWPLQFTLDRVIAHDQEIYLTTGEHPAAGGDYARDIYGPYLPASVLEEGEDL